MVVIGDETGQVALLVARAGLQGGGHAPVEQSPPGQIGFIVNKRSQ